MRRKNSPQELDPDDIFLDSRNLPSFKVKQFEGVIERPLGQMVFVVISIFLVFIFLLFLGRVFLLQVVNFNEYMLWSAGNSLEQTTIFSERGVIYDRNNIEIAWNGEGRTYTPNTGLSHALGYVSFPTEEEIKELNFNPKEFVGRDGAEKIFNEKLRGEHGVQIIEVDVTGNILSESLLRTPIIGENVSLSIDSRIQQTLYSNIRDLSLDRGFTGGAGVLLDIITGEVIAITSFPEYDSEVLSNGTDEKLISSYRIDERKPFLNRAVSGLYTPGSVFKPIVAAAALEEGIITPEQIIQTNGTLAIPHPYIEDEVTLFYDWKNHGPVNLYDAIAYSSNIYFYKIGGGFEKERGLGISRIANYAREFGLGGKVNSGFISEKEGLVPTPKWKESIFNDEWRVGDTYNTAIGQFALQVTPLQMARAVGAIANGGTLITPTIEKRDTTNQDPAGNQISISPENLAYVAQGMRRAVEYGTASGLELPFVNISAKTGTAEIDFGKQFVNSWVIGFFPSDAPRFAFSVVMERGPRENYIGGVFIARQLFEWMNENTPEYFN